MIKIVLFLSIIIGMQMGCEERSKTDVAQVHWDRDMCKECVMIISDRQNSVQVRDPQTGKSYMFDDIGCMVLWFKAKNISWKDQAVIWITDLKTGKWIDARRAFYDKGNVTPMAFGFSAHQTKKSMKPNKEIFNFKQVIQEITNR